MNPMIDMRTIRPEEETVQIHKVKFLSNQWGAPKVMEEVVCDDVEIPSFFYIDTWKELANSIHV